MIKYLFRGIVFVSLCLFLGCWDNCSCNGNGSDGSTCNCGNITSCNCSGGGSGNSCNCADNPSVGGSNIDNLLIGIWAENTPEAGFFFEFFSDGTGIEHYIIPDEGIHEQISIEWWIPNRNTICIIGKIEFDGCVSYDIRNGNWIFRGVVRERVDSLPNNAN